MVTCKYSILLSKLYLHSLIIYYLEILFEKL